MAMPLDLILVRHGESVGNTAVAGAKAGKPTPPPEDQHSSRLWVLTDRGRTQAEKAGAWLREHGFASFDRLYCSPYVRTMQTAALLRLPGAEWWLETLLRERDRGYEYVAPKPDLADAFPHSVRTKKDDSFLWRPTAGESIPDVDLRLRGVLATLAREMAGKQVLCVTHEDAMNALRFRLEKMTIAEWTEANDGEAERIPNGGILHYARRNPEDPTDEQLRFGWVRLVDPCGEGGFPWRPIARPRFSNEDLTKMAEEEGTQFAGS